MELLTDREIADRYGTYQVKINRLRKRLGIPTMSKGERAERALPPLTDRQVQLITGSLLGDGWMDATSDHSARFGEGHCVEQVDYTEWKAGILGPYVSNTYETRKTVPGRVSGTALLT